MARADLFKGATVILTPTERSAPPAVEARHEFWEALGGAGDDARPGHPRPRGGGGQPSAPSRGRRARRRRGAASIRASSTWPRAASRTPPGSPPRTRASGGRSSRRTARRSARRSPRFGRPSTTSTGSSRAGMRPRIEGELDRIRRVREACGEDPRHARGAPAPRRRRPVKGRGTHELVVTIDGPAGAGKSTTARGARATPRLPARRHGRALSRPGLGGPRSRRRPRRRRAPSARSSIGPGSSSSATACWSMGATSAERSGRPRSADSRRS